jgi:hypothetical protein
MYVRNAVGGPSRGKPLLQCDGILHFVCRGGFDGAQRGVRGIESGPLDLCWVVTFSCEPTPPTPHEGPKCVIVMKCELSLLAAAAKPHP